MADPIQDSAAVLAADTIELLETRLKRLEYLLTGDVSWTGEVGGISHPTSSNETVSARLENVENEIFKLMAKVPAVREILTLYTRFPDLFQTVPPTQLPATPDQQTIIAIIFSYATAFPETASRLTALKDLPIPPASESAALASLQPRLDKLTAEQAEQTREIAELRTRTALLMQRWLEVGVVGGSDVWSEWEERIEAAERRIRQWEVQAQKAAEEI
ncbi:hypothetical protein KEM56_007891 [Ascosphaera pollenicola]|nr:hypothetical protein KEM56_007891 [Ascosphaera pollenicola]